MPIPGQRAFFTIACLLAVLACLISGCAAPVPWHTPEYAPLSAFQGGVPWQILSDTQRGAIDAVMAFAEEIGVPQEAHSPQANAAFAVGNYDDTKRLYADASLGWAIIAERQDGALRYRYYDAPELCALLESFTIPGPESALEQRALVSEADLAGTGTAVNWQSCDAERPEIAGFTASARDGRVILTAAFDAPRGALAFIDRVEVCPTIIRVSARVLHLPNISESGLCWAAISVSGGDLPARPIVFVDEAQNVLAVTPPPY